MNLDIPSIGIFLSTAALGLSLSSFLISRNLKKEIKTSNGEIKTLFENINKRLDTFCQEPGGDFSTLTNDKKIHLEEFNCIEDRCNNIQPPNIPKTIYERSRSFDDLTNFYNPIKVESTPSTPPPSVASPQPPEVGSSLPTPMVSALGTPYRIRTPELYQNETVLANSPDLSPESESETLFKEELGRQSLTRTQILQKGKDVGREPIQLITVQPGTGRYLTNTQIDAYRQSHQNFKKLSIEDEIYILREFRHLEGEKLLKVKEKVERDGYQIVISRVNHIKIGCFLSAYSNADLNVYDATCLYVTVNDPYFDWDSKKVSGSAIVEKILSVGCDK